MVAWWRGEEGRDVPESSSHLGYPVLSLEREAVGLRGQELQLTVPPGRVRAFGESPVLAARHSVAPDWVSVGGQRLMSAQRGYLPWRRPPTMNTNVTEIRCIGCGTDYPVDDYTLGRTGQGRFKIV